MRKTLTPVDVCYHYYRDTHNRPLVTLCRVILHQEFTGYGWAICTDPTPHYETRTAYCPLTDTMRIVRGGRRIAHGRALAALTPRRGVHLLCQAPAYRFWRPIRRREAFQVLEQCPGAEALLRLVECNSTEALPLRMQPYPQGRMIETSSDTQNLSIAQLDTLSEAKAEVYARGVRYWRKQREFFEQPQTPRIDTAGYLVPWWDEQSI